jgi:hypothetical protein
VHGNPPNIATGLVGAVGHIHLICHVKFKQNHMIKLFSSAKNIFFWTWKNYGIQWCMCASRSCVATYNNNNYTYIWKGKGFQELGPAAKQSTKGGNSFSHRKVLSKLPRQHIKIQLQRGHYSSSRSLKASYYNLGNTFQHLGTTLKVEHRASAIMVIV